MWRAQWRQQRSPSASHSTQSQHTLGMSKPAVPWRERGESDTPHTLSFCLPESSPTMTNTAKSKILTLASDRITSPLCIFSKKASLLLQSTCQSGLDEVAGRCKLRHCPVDRTLNWANLISTALSAVLDYLQYFGKSSLNMETMTASPHLQCSLPLHRGIQVQVHEQQRNLEDLGAGDVHRIKKHTYQEIRLDWYTSKTTCCYNYILMISVVVMKTCTVPKCFMCTTFPMWPIWRTEQFIQNMSSLTSNITFHCSFIWVGVIDKFIWCNWMKRFSDY